MCSTTSNLDDAAPVQDEPVMIERADYSSTIEDEDEDEEEEPVEDEDEEEDDEEEESEQVEGMGKLVKDLFHSDYAKVNAALDVLIVNLGKDTEQCETFTFWGGCAAVVELVQHCLKKAMKKIPVCGRVVELNELAELTTLNKSFARHHPLGEYAQFYHGRNYSGWWNGRSCGGDEDVSKVPSIAGVSV
jgi:hypothetical protein